MTQDEILLKPIPQPLSWDIAPSSFQVDSDNTISMTAGAKTDLFRDPAGTAVSNNSPRLLFEPSDPFILSARVTVDFKDTFDAGVLVLYDSEKRWAKLCFEYSPQGVPTIVSVVTQGLSDDCNSSAIDGSSVYLRVARLGQAFAFHYSLDASSWQLVRHFSLGELEHLRLGFSVQAPTGSSCRAVFSEIGYEQRILEDIRSGE